ncbi:MAG: hypothetical protein KatS3mg127_1247 [Silanimonas sp.]|nr:MAG: hypothetical protein KatS3mg127_1247 [Silanimonas sp.]
MSASRDLRLQVILSAIDRATGPLRKVMGGSSALAKALKATQGQLKELEEKQRNIQGFQKLRAQLRGTEAALRAAGSRSVDLASKLETQRAAHYKLVGDVKAARLEFARLGSEMKGTMAPSAELNRAYALARDRLSRLESRYSESTNALRRTKTAIKETSKSVESLTSRQAQLSQRLDAVRQKLSAAGVSTERLAAQKRQIRLETERVNKALDQQRARLGKLAEAQKLASRMHSGGMTAAAHGAGMAIGGGAVLNQAAAQMQPALDFESRMRDIAITGGFSREQEAALGATVMADAKRFGQFTNVIGDGLAVMVANGVSEMEKLKTYSGVLAKGSVATGAMMDDLALVAVTMEQTLGLATGEVKGGLDSLAYSGKQGSFELRDMAKWLPNLSPMMASLGAKGRAAVDELGAALQVARLGAGSSDEAANNLRNYLSKLTSPDTIKDFAKAGIDLKGRLLELQAQGISPLQGSLQIITEYMGRKGPEAMRKLREAAALKDDAQRQAALEQLASAYALGDLFQDAQAMAFVRPALANMDKMQAIRHGASQANGVIDEDWAARMGTGQKQLDMFNIRLQDLKLKAGALLMPTLNQLADSAGRLLDRISAFAQQHPVLASGLLKAALAGIAFVTVLGVLLTIGGTAAMAIGNIVKVVSLLSGGAGFSALLGPIGLVLLIVGALAVAAYLIYRNWEPIKAWFLKLWAGIVAVASWAWGWIKRLFAFTPLGMVIANWGRIKDYLAQLWAGIKQYVAGAWTAITGIFSGDGAKIRAGLEQMWQAINGILGGWPQKLMQAGIEMIDGLVQGIRAKLGAVKEALSSIGSGAVGALKSLLGIRSPSRVFAQLGVYTMQGFAGGLDRGQDGPLARLAGFGDQLRRVAAGLVLAPLAAPALAFDTRPPLAAAAAGAGAAGGGVHIGAIHIHAAPGMDAEAIARAVRQEIERLERDRAARRRSGLYDYGD